MADPVSTSISVLALLVSGLTAWMNLLRRGALRMTRPTFIAFNYDRTEGRPLNPKIFVCGLLYSTGARGRVIENLYAKLGVDGTSQEFTVWGHGNAVLSRGSGLFVPPTGIAENHHFNPAADMPEFRFVAGEYTLTIFAEVVAERAAKELCSVSLLVPSDALSEILDGEAAIWFDWDPDKKRHRAHVETRPGAIQAPL